MKVLPITTPPLRGVFLNHAIPFYLPAAKTDIAGTTIIVDKIALNLAFACIILNFS